MYHIKDYHDRQEKGDGKEGIAAKIVFCTDEKKNGIPIWKKRD
jgi:hypothetical protein